MKLRVKNQEFFGHLRTFLTGQNQIRGQEIEKSRSDAKLRFALFAFLADICLNQHNQIIG